MRLYLDDDFIARPTVMSLKVAGHDVQIPADIGFGGESDPMHLLHAILDQRLIVTHNHEDFEELHNLVVQSGSSHPGILVIRRDNDKRRHLTPARLVRAIGNLIAAGSPLRNALIVLNHWQ